ncbi:MAG: protein kinase [Deltaproteobacteria bacterium]|jgi:serine/threonine-protein kinase|nr:protein kinase [Deltaproteobacteria bacterium]MBW2530120.1 protein kinase [Deltaproteobacteria bacterium]
MEPPSKSPAKDPPIDAEAATILRVQTGAKPKSALDDEESPPTKRFARASSEGAGSLPPAVDVRPRPLDGQPFDERYRPDRVLGQGGMGEVWRCADDRIGREVAMKVIHSGRGTGADVQARFEREARIQGQLEHPSIVPVYDLGVRPDGAAYFTMKRIVGRTLDEILVGLREEDADVEAAYSRRKLLSAFSQACQAVAFAHQRGVVHRDLKPANIILGPFGEVYVLDWGVAKVMRGGEETEPLADDAPSHSSAPAPANSAERCSDAEAATVLASTGGSGAIGSDATEAGTLLGTPGYMSPEQAAGEIDAIDERADVYALGTILFELLTLAPLHQGMTGRDLIASTLAGADARPRTRGATTVAPELEAICVRATSLLPHDRYDAVLEIHHAIERYLDGDRDLQRRRDMSREYEQQAERIVDEARDDPESHVRARSRAIAELNKAVALDPSNESALAAMVRLVVESPEELSPDAEEEFRRARVRDLARSGRAGALAVLSLFLLDPLLAWMGIRSHFALALGLPFMLGTATALYLASRTKTVKPSHFYIVATLSASVAAWTGLLFGSFMLVPGAVVGFAAPTAVALRATSTQRAFMMVTGALAVVVPFALQQLGLIPPSYAFEGGVITILPLAMEFPPVPSQLFLVGASLVIIVAPLYVIGSAIDRLVRAERHLFGQAYNLRELMPAAARDEAGAQLVQPPESTDRSPCK